VRYGIFSDIHSNVEALDAVIQAYRTEDIDKYLCIGDIVGYAANPNECIEKAKMLAMISVAGNHDRACVNLFSADYLNPFAKEAVIWTQSNLDDQSKYFLEHLPFIYKNEDLTMVHGTLDEPQDFHYMSDGYTASKTFGLLETDVCFVGHTHVPGIFIHSQQENLAIHSEDEQRLLSINHSRPRPLGRGSRRLIKSENGNIAYQKESGINIKEGNKYIIDVGSVGQPRDGNPEAAYCIYDTKKKNIEIKRVSYDIQAARGKIINAGLPGFLAERLLLGR